MNTIIKGKGFYVSYNPMVGETALVKNAKEKKFKSFGMSLITDKEFFILMGDYTTEYKPLVKKGYKACKTFFDKSVKKGAKVSFWSN